MSAYLPSSPTTTVAAPSGPRVMVSARNDRSAARALAACSLVRTETVFVYAENDGFSSVQFLLDGAPVRLELVAPWDFAGGSTTLANGTPESADDVRRRQVSALAQRAPSMLDHAQQVARLAARLRGWRVKRHLTRKWTCAEVQTARLSHDRRRTCAFGIRLHL